MDFGLRDPAPQEARELRGMVVWCLEGSVEGLQSRSLSTYYMRWLEDKFKVARLHWRAWWGISQGELLRGISVWVSPGKGKKWA